MENNSYGDGIEHQIYVVPGHYRNKYENSETEGGISKLDVIRVYGPDPKREGFWICDDGKPRTDSNILDNYQLMDVVSSKENVANNSHLFFDFEPIEPPKKKQTHKIALVGTEATEAFKLFPEQESASLKNVFDGAEVIDVSKIFPNIQPININIDVAIIEKLNILTYNDSIVEKYGDVSLCKPVKNIEICFDIPFMYDLENLCKTVTMLNLDEKVISEYLTNRVLEVVDIKTLLNREITNMLTDMNYSLKTEKVQEFKKESQPELREEHQPELKEEIAPELSNGIENIDKYLSNYI